MKKVITFILLIIITFFVFTGTTTSQANILLFETEDIMGATHEKVKRELSVSGSTILQTYHYLSADFDNAPFSIITGDDYTATGYKPATTVTHAENSSALYDEYVIIGGVNADFFESYGVPQEAYVENGQVISSGIGYVNREVIGFKEDGSVVFGKPVFDGYEVIIRDANGRERITLPLKNVNAPYTDSPIDIYAYFDTYNTQLPSGVKKYVANVTETKGAVPKIFGSGVVSTVRSEVSLVVPDQSLVLVSDNIYLRNLVQTGDTMIVQRRMIGDFEGVRWAVGAYGKLVSEGEKVSNIIGIDPTSRHPRTAIGVKDDGSVFFVAMDGRQPGYSQGATLYEMADLMLSYGAVTAYNFDGGGSTTMVLKNDSSGFDVVNQPSDGTPRIVTNSIFLALRVNFDNQTPYPIPNYAIRLDTPSNLQVDSGILTFDAIEGKESYLITIDGQDYTSSSNRFDLRNIIITPNTYQIIVKAQGDGMFYKDSYPSVMYEYTYNGPVKLDDIKNLTLSSTSVLSWDEVPGVDTYLFEVGDKVYTIYLNKFNLSTLSLEPGIYTFEITAIGDHYNTDDSDVTYYTYRVYSDSEKSIKDSLRLILELLFLRNRE
jgi:hypothetical protein